MKSFRTVTSVAAPLRVDNVDTDQIIPASFLTTVSRQGMGEGLFHASRFTGEGLPDPEFVLNRPEFEGAQILLAGENFGSGSSREHAVWALTDYGFRVVIACSYSDIFYHNSLKNGLLPVELPKEQVDQLFRTVDQRPGTLVTVDLETEAVSLLDGSCFAFEIDEFSRHCLLKGIDHLGFLLEHLPQIEAYERSHGRDGKDTLCITARTH